MEKTGTVIAVFADHNAAETAVKKLTAAGFEMKNLSVVGKGYQTDEKVVGFYNSGDRIKFWGTRGAFWGGLWGMFFGGLFLTIPVLGHVVVLGYLASMVICENRNDCACFFHLILLENELGNGRLARFGLPVTPRKRVDEQVPQYSSVMRQR